ncbi:MAG: 2-5 ligase superfamily [Crocinitomicaceae bacterium]|jgi:2'-5' RNA ligase|nr:2-5 ligase superfamily [Crocinitomicaceae bacterium]
MQGTLFDIHKEEYLIVVSPPNSLIKTITEIKQMLQGLIGSSTNSIPHITVYNREFDGDYKDVVIRKAEEILLDIQCFEVELYEWILFENPHVDEKIAVLKVKNPKPVRQLTTLFSRKLKKAFQNNTPHLTLVRNISSKNLQRLTPVLNDIKFNVKFKCSKLILLRREMQNEKWTGYENIREFPLK